MCPRLVAESPVRSAVVYPLGVGGRDLGVLAVYSHQPAYFAPPLVDLGVVFAAYASLALENVKLEDRAHHLKLAVASHQRIGVAVGILMARNNLTEPQAFDLLRVRLPEHQRQAGANRRRRGSGRDAAGVDPPVSGAWQRLAEQSRRGRAPSPGRRGRLSVEVVLDHAMQLARTQGQGGVSMRRVAVSAGVEVMSLYRYVPSKAALIVLMADRSATQALADADLHRDRDGAVG